jgi:hypothetical protein
MIPEQRVRNGGGFYWICGYVMRRMIGTQPLKPVSYFPHCFNDHRMARAACEA